MSRHRDRKKKKVPLSIHPFEHKLALDLWTNWAQFKQLGHKAWVRYVEFSMIDEGILSDRVLAEIRRREAGGA